MCFGFDSDFDIRISDLKKIMKNINVGIIGLGTVGGGVAKALLEKESFIFERSGVSVKLLKAYDKDKKKIKKLGLPSRVIATDPVEIFGNTNVDILVELIGGIHPAQEMIMKAIQASKHIVTANKALLAEQGERIFNAAKNSGSLIGFEASVGGAMPVIKVLHESFSSNRISAIYGIVNGTCNYVMHKMMEANCGMADALKEAKAKGIAEQDPKLDVAGIDSCHKLCILTMLAFGCFVTPKDVYIEGIKHIDLQDIVYARNWGYDIKLLAIAKFDKCALQLRVHPTLIPLSHLLSAVKNEDNAVFIKGDMIGDSMIYGKGAGRMPAASSVVSDIIDIAKCINRRAINLASSIKSWESGCKMKLSRMGDLQTRYYLRFSAIDEPGVLSSISNVLAKNKISIATVTQKQRNKGEPVPIVMLTHEAREASMEKALKDIDKLPCIKKRTVRIRMER